MCTNKTKLPGGFLRFLCRHIHSKEITNCNKSQKDIGFTMQADSCQELTNPIALLSVLFFIVLWSIFLSIAQNNHANHLPHASSNCLDEPGWRERENKGAMIACQSYALLNIHFCKASMFLYLYHPAEAIPTADMRSRRWWWRLESLNLDSY